MDIAGVDACGIGADPFTHGAGDGAGAVVLVIRADAVAHGAGDGRSVC